MLCDEAGQLKPKQDRGYYIDNKETDQVSVYRCRNPLECPAGEAGACAQGRTGVGCGNCVGNHYKATGGKCLPCEGVDLLPILFTVIFLIGCLVGLYIHSKTDVSRLQLTTVTAGLITGQLTCTVQSLSVFRELDIQWDDPIDSFLRFIKLFTLDLNVVKIQCVFPKDDPVVNFLVALAIFPGFMASLALMTFVMQAIGKARFDKDRYLNSVGLIAVICYISITVTMLRPLHCLTNPNGASSMASNPAVVCWDSSQHKWLVLLGIVGIILYPITILAIIVQVTWRYPALISSSQGLKLLIRYRFLFQRFTAERYFWGACYLLRNFVIALCPVIFYDTSVCWSLYSQSASLGRLSRLTFSSPDLLDFDLADWADWAD